MNLFPSQAVLTQHITANHASNLNSNGTTPAAVASTAAAAAASQHQQQQQAQQQQQIILNLNGASDASSYAQAVSGKTPLGVLFQCDQCQDIFSDKSLLEYHTIEAHSKFLANGENSDLIRTAMAVTNGGTAGEQSTKTNDKNSIFVMLGAGGTAGGGTETLYS